MTRFSKKPHKEKNVLKLFAVVIAGGVVSAALLGAATMPRGAPEEATPKLAFPGAEGHGRFAVGGRGGRIIEVTTLSDSGEGSLRACINAEGPRVCVFRVGGVIRFTSKRPVIYNPYITIAGETAPGEGILLTHDGGDIGLTPLVVKNTHDVVIRHIRVRPDKTASQRSANDAFTIENSERVIIDHVSGSWALDEIYNGQGDNDDITISWSIFAEGVPSHDKCALLASDPVDPQNVSFIKNLCASNGDRNPDANFPKGSCVEVVNNVFYNARSEFAEIWESYGGTPISMVGNVFKSGPSTLPSTPAINRVEIESTGASAVYLEDNRLIGLEKLHSSNLDAVIAKAPPCALTFEPIASSKVLDVVLDHAGAMPRDSIDMRLVEEVRRTGGRIADGPGVLPELSLGEAPVDMDRDGMADSWERIQGTDDTRYDPWEDIDGDGWSNLEEYLDQSHQLLIGNAE